MPQYISAYHTVLAHFYFLYFSERYSQFIFHVHTNPYTFLRVRSVGQPDEIRLRNSSCPRFLGMIISSSSDLTVKHKIAFYVTYLLLLSSQLFAICYFTVSYKWWVIGVLSFHTCAVVAAAAIQSRGEAKYNGVTVSILTFFIGIHCLRDDTVDFAFKVKPEGLSTVLLSNILFVVENFFMILMFYFSPHSNTWYSLPVTVCVCVFSALGSIMRITLLRHLVFRENVVHPQGESDGNLSVDK